MGGDPVSRARVPSTNRPFMAASCAGFWARLRFQSLSKRARFSNLVGVEQPVLRELPSWWPGGDGEAQPWRYGHIGFLCVDGHGDVRLVETKLSSNADDLLVCKGLDYYIWARKRRRLIDRLSAPDGEPSRSTTSWRQDRRRTSPVRLPNSASWQPGLRRSMAVSDCPQLVRASGQARYAQLEGFPPGE
jgi:hypothetical protein